MSNKKTLFILDYTGSTNVVGTTESITTLARAYIAACEEYVLNYGDESDTFCMVNEHSIIPLPKLFDLAAFGELDSKIGGGPNVSRNMSSIVNAEDYYRVVVCHDGNMRFEAPFLGFPENVTYQFIIVSLDKKDLYENLLPCKHCGCVGKHARNCLTNKREVVSLH